MKVKVDLDLCQGHSVCLEECPEVFNVVEQPGGYHQVVLLVEEPSEVLRDQVVIAARFCPNRVISIED